MDSWERFTAGSGVSKLTVVWGVFVLYRFARLHPPWERSAELQGQGGHGGS